MFTVTLLGHKGQPLTLCTDPVDRKLMVCVVDGPLPTQTINSHVVGQTRCVIAIKYNVPAEAMQPFAKTVKGREHLDLTP